ncbi:hypothetical protein [Ornithinibacillus sp. 179-J 7C1 HS]|uniref:hypothetical protein n=1 Tax=Ornithinibacillus sp. 179-J 7C1 HS TaxID=3142384 RepID=UPI0039A347E4
MSIASISYSSLRNAASEAKSVAKRLDNYADAIDKTVYGKLNSYNGPWSSNLSTAKSRASSKISKLRDQSTKYDRYAEDLTDLREQCQATDKSVRTKVSSLTATFKENHGIKDNKVINAISYFFTKISNDTAIGRWLGDVRDQFSARFDYFKQSISDWFHWDGGKELLKGILVFAVELALGVATIALAVITGGALLVVIAGVIAGSIMILNSLVNMANEGRAYQATRADDPATGRRLSSLNTLSDTMRQEDSRFLHGFANTLDAVNTVCTIVTVVSGLGNLAKKGFKWATGNPASLDSIKVKDILTNANLNTFTGKLKTTIGNGWIETTKAIQRGDWQFFSGTAKNFGTDFLNNLKGDFWKFSNTIDSVKSTKNILSSINLLNSNGLNLTSLGIIALVRVPVANLPGETHIQVGDFKSLIDDTSKSFKGIRDMFSNQSPIDTDIMNSLSQSGNQ